MSIIPVKKRHTIKALLIVCLLTGLIIGVYCDKGRIHDYGLWKKKKLTIGPGVHIWADLGFVGLHKVHPYAHLPHKSSKYHPLTAKQNQDNKQQAKQRIPIEHINRECKIFKIVKDVYRGKHKHYGLHWNLIAALTNLKKACRHFSQATP